MRNQIVTDTNGDIITNPRIARLLFDDTRFAAVWLVVRILLGWQRVQAGLHKVSNPAWMQTGTALQGYWTNAVTIPAAENPPRSDGVGLSTLLSATTEQASGNKNCTTDDRGGPGDIAF